MDEPSPDPIPVAVRETFQAAVAACEIWGGDDPEPQVSFEQRPISITLVCDLAAQYEDDVPENVVRVLVNRLGAPNMQSCSYKEGAGYLAEAYQERRLRFQQDGAQR